jgi:hypothetical protein
MRRSTTMDREEAAEILLDAKEAIEEALEQARTALRAVDDDFPYEQADAYWLAHIRTALDREHGYLSGSMVTMQDTIDALQREEED